MPNPTHDRDGDVVKWFTRARRFPQLIGKTYDGKSIWGGPYTYTQVIVFVAILVIGSRTTNLWGHFGAIANSLICVGVAYGSVVLLGQIPVGSRNPLWIVSGAFRSLTYPSTGRLCGRPVRISKPHRVKGRLTVTTAPRHVVEEHSSELAPEPWISPTPQEMPTPTRVKAPATVVQRLLATQTATRED